MVPGLVMILPPCIGRMEVIAGQTQSTHMHSVSHLEMAAQNLVDNQLHAFHLCWEYIFAQPVQLVEAPGVGQRFLSTVAPAGSTVPRP